jgi:hypothetical protein
MTKTSLIYCVALASIVGLAWGEETLMGLCNINGSVYETYFDPVELRHPTDDNPAKLKLVEVADHCLKKLKQELPEFRKFEAISIDELRYKEGALYLVIFEEAPIRRFGEHKEPLENLYVY